MRAVVVIALLLAALFGLAWWKRREESAAAIAAGGASPTVKPPTSSLLGLSNSTCGIGTSMLGIKGGSADTICSFYNKFNLLNYGDEAKAIGGSIVNTSTSIVGAVGGAVSGAASSAYNNTLGRLF